MNDTVVDSDLLEDIKDIILECLNDCEIRCIYQNGSPNYCACKKCKVTDVAIKLHIIQEDT